MSNICLKCGNMTTEDDLDVRYNHNEIIECGACCDMANGIPETMHPKIIEMKQLLGVELNAEEMLTFKTKRQWSTTRYPVGFSPVKDDDE